MKNSPNAISFFSVSAPLVSACSGWSPASSGNVENIDILFRVVICERVWSGDSGDQKRKGLEMLPLL